MKFNNSGSRNISQNSLLNWKTTTLLSIIVLGLILRLWNLGAESAWIDEAYSIHLSSYSLPGIIQGTAADQHPPLYYLLLHAWGYLGSGLTHARLLSVVIGTTHIGYLYYLAKKWGSFEIGLWAALLLAISPIHIWYSQEARMYILLALLTTAASYELISALRGEKRWIHYGLYTTLSLYTHNFAAFILLAHGVYVVYWWWVHKNTKIVLRWTAAIIIVILAYAPWIPTLIRQTRYHTMDWISSPGITDFRDTLVRMLIGDISLQFPGNVRWIFTSLLLFLIFGALLVNKSRREKNQPLYSYSLIWAFIPFISISIVSIVYPIFQYKQFLVLLAPFLIGITLTLQFVPKPARFLIFGALIIFMLVSLTDQQTALTKDDWKQATFYIESQWEENDIIYANPAAASLALSLYWNDPLDFQGYPPDYSIMNGGWEGEVITGENVTENMKTVMEGARRVWLLEFFPQLWDPEGHIQNWIQSRADLIDERYFGRVRLRLYEFEDS